MIESSDNILIYDIPTGDEGRKYISSVFEKVYSLSEGVAVWLWSPATSSVSAYNKALSMQNKLISFREEKSKRSESPALLMYSYKKENNNSENKDQIIELLVESWYDYDRPSIYFLMNKVFLERRANAIVNRQSRCLSEYDIKFISPYICLYRDGFEEEIWINNVSDIPFKELFPNIDG